MRRASASVPCNISEGLGRMSLRDQRRFFHIARGSVYEVAALLDVAVSFNLVRAEIHEQTKELCDHIAAMLSRL
jgi:four helix bundle protein